MAPVRYLPAVQSRETPEGGSINIYKNVRVDGPKGKTMVSQEWGDYLEFMRRHHLTPETYPDRLRMAAKELLKSGQFTSDKTLSRQVLAWLANSA